MKIRLYLITLLVIFSLAGCDNSNDEANNAPAVVSFDIEPKLSVLDIGTSEHFQALVTYSNGDVTDVSDTAAWTLENQSGIIEAQEDPDGSGHFLRSQSKPVVTISSRHSII
jgi:hypothetical protein